MITHQVVEITTSEFRFHCFPNCSMSAFILAPGSVLCVSYPLMKFALLVFLYCLKGSTDGLRSHLTQG